jgi:hypothetical protein
MTSRQVFFLGVIVGAVAIVLLFVFPAGGIWLPLFVLSGALTGLRTSRPGSTSDVSSMALTIAFFGVALLFAFFLIPDSFWGNFSFRVPEWAYARDAQNREVVPVWARVGLAVIWSVLTLRRSQQLANRASGEDARAPLLG